MGKTTPRILFMGSDAMALPLLNWLYERLGREHLTICTQPDRPQGRGKQVTPNAIKAWANENKLKLLQPEAIDVHFASWASESVFDFALVMAYGHLLPEYFLNSFAHGVFNIHTSLLPAYRGASPIEAAIANGDARTGLTLMKMVLKMDAGPILGQLPIEIAPEDTRSRLRQKMSDQMPALIQRHFDQLRSDTLPLREQDETQVSYARKILKTDGLLDFTRNAQDLVQQMKALENWPGCFIETPDGIRLKVGNAQAVEAAAYKSVFEASQSKKSSGAEGAYLETCNPTSYYLDHLDKTRPGMVLDLGPNGLIIQTRRKLLCIEALQRPGGRMLPIAEFLRGFEGLSPLQQLKAFHTPPFWGTDWKHLRAQMPSRLKARTSDTPLPAKKTSWALS